MKVKIGHIRYPVLAMSNAEGELLDALGYYDPNEVVIKIGESLEPAEQGRVLIHELLHACISVFKIPGIAHEEDLVGHLDVALTTMLQDNPWLLTTIHQAVSNGKRIFRKGKS